MSKQKQIAGFVKENLDDLSARLMDAIEPDMQEMLKPLISKWLDNHVAFFSGKPCRMGEWAAHFVESSREQGIPTARAYSGITQLRQSLIHACLGTIPDVSDVDIISSLSDSAAHFEQAVVEYFAQRMSEDRVANQRRQKSIMESVDQPMAIVNADGDIEAANRSLGRLLKTSPKALTGLNMLTFCDEPTATQLRTFLRRKRVEPTKSTFSGALAFGTETVNAQFSCQPFFDVDGLRTGAAVFIDDDGQENVENNIGIKHFEEYILPMLPFPLQVVDRAGNITYSSGQLASLNIAGYNGQEPLFCHLYQRRFGDDRACPCKQIFESGAFHMEEITFDNQAEMKWFVLFALPLPDGAGHINRILTGIYDLSRRKQAQKQLESHVIKQQRSSLVAQLSITVAHQLRNPLSVVLGFAEMMSKGLAPDQYAEAVSRILRNSLRCKDIVENLLDFGKGMPLERRPVDFEVLIRESVRPLLTPAQNRLIEWRFSGKPAPIECVPEQMAQVVLSLLDNALRMAEKRIVCAVENKGDLIRLRVVDDGPGIELDVRDRIFEPFFSTRREEGATGLGLSLARAVVTDYGGSLTVSAPGANDPRGACLVVQLPLMKKTEKAEADTEPASPEISEKRILIVDDEADLQELLKTSLYMRGYLADTVATGMEALEKLKETDYDALVLDYLLKGALSGQQLYREIADQYPDYVPRVLFITADMLNYQTRLFVESTGRPVLEKPFLIADFMTELNKLMT